MPGKPLILNEIRIDKDKPRGVVKAKMLSLNHNKLLFVLLERDSSRPIEQIEAAVRIYQNELLNAYYNYDYNLIIKYLGDEDILGMKILENDNNNGSIVFEFSGFQKMDRYRYQIKLQQGRIK